ncbi:HpcH/HpaI aldolase/citrate lyase family protein [Antarcticirhabdus aurantiaca]|uniref:CoA ester lyase n=1 Tax=Antarcticirhabdus aurantiaca TaxID=2606717 RepID=A0ACD4NP11_9HYPH|nr:CoA ester lyase [Antarcticirhabdus aurantiaca]WAJ28556.1 CoA ester lyase [Jeongeuplla avenae]
METSRRRSVLFMPASNPRAIEKARSLACDGVILDLEDAVAEERKAEARQAAVAALSQGGFGARASVVRVNGPGTAHFGADAATLADIGPDVAVLLPKVEAPGDVEAAARHLPNRPLWAMIETCRGVLGVGEIARAAERLPLAALVLGPNDLAREMGCRLSPSRRPIWGALTQIVLAARGYGLLALDGVFNDIEDEAGFEAEAREGADFGFDGKTLIHPRQIEPCHRAFAPDPVEVAFARCVVEAFHRPENAARNALRVEGRMVERLHLAGAERILARAGEA